MLAVVKCWVNKGSVQSVHKGGVNSYRVNHQVS